MCYGRKNESERKFVPSNKPKHANAKPYKRDRNKNYMDYE